MPRQYKTIPVALRLKRYSAFDANGCCLWTGSTRAGYGHIRIDGQDYSVHRLVWQMAFGVIPRGMQVQHLCNTPRCFLLAHLTLGTPKQNSEYMVESGHASIGARNGAYTHPENVPRGDTYSARGDRLPSGQNHWTNAHPEKVLRGESHGRAKLTAELVLTMRARHAAGEDAASIARAFGISAMNAWQVVTRRSWKHVP